VRSLQERMGWTEEQVNHELKKKTILRLEIEYLCSAKSNLSPAAKKVFMDGLKWVKA
jgi:hypothetical protein